MVCAAEFPFPQRDQSLLLPADMREWLPEDDLVLVVLDAVTNLDLDEFRSQHRADDPVRAAPGPEMMVALLLYAYCQGGRPSRVIEQRHGVAGRTEPGWHQAAQIVGPVFGQIKICQNLTRMPRRGFGACRSEWLLTATAHNLRKLHTHRLSA